MQCPCTVLGVFKHKISVHDILFNKFTSTLFNFLFLNTRPQCLLFKPHEQTLTQSECAWFSSVIMDNTAYSNLPTTKFKSEEFCEMAKAYNCVSHTILLAKFHFKAFEQVHNYISTLVSL
jgi:hypothetical protein